MPYIIATLAPDPDDVAAGCNMVSTLETRTAVATLDEARKAAYRIRRERYPSAYGQINLAESGGVVGPLPDGTVIEVQHVHWDELRAAAKVPSTASDAMTVAAFNRKQ